MCSKVRFFYSFFFCLSEVTLVEFIIIGGFGNEE